MIRKFPLSVTSYQSPRKHGAQSIGENRMLIKKLVIWSNVRCASRVVRHQRNGCCSLMCCSVIIWNTALNYSRYTKCASSNSSAGSYINKTDWVRNSSSSQIMLNYGMGGLELWWCPRTWQAVFRRKANCTVIYKSRSDILSSLHPEFSYIIVW